MQIEFENPPLNPRIRRGGRPPKYLPLLEQLKESPGDWAVIERCENSHRAYNLSSNMRRRIIKIPEGAFEFTAQHTGACWTVYARALPE